VDAGAPNRFGPYEVQSELGRGGMGVVHRARHQESGAVVALKVLGDAGGPEAAARFQREVRLAAELDHPGIVRCLASGVEEGWAWFAMELVEGR
jgi:serine/threonine protein kinase